jgi:hypothetical protein
VQVFFDKLRCDRLIRAFLVLVAIALGLFEPVIQNPSQTCDSRLPSKSSPDGPKPLGLRNAYSLSDHYPDTTRTRKPYRGLNGPRRFEEIERRRVDSKIKAMLVAREKRRSVHLYLTMDHPASSPGRWRC